MIDITLTFTETESKIIGKYLRQRYGKDKHIDFKRLCVMAIRKEVIAESEIDDLKHIHSIEEELSITQRCDLCDVLFKAESPDDVICHYCYEYGMLEEAIKISETKQNIRA